MMNSVLPHTLKEWLDKGEAVIIDVREPAEYESEHIAGAISVPLGGVCCAKLPDAKGKKLVVQCHLGGRSRTACEKLVSENSGQEVWNLEGGITAWKQAGFQVEKSEGGRCVLPISQQMQLIVGTGVLAGVLLGANGFPLFLYLAGFFGAGLIFAGLTGICPLMCILSHMPWNKASTCQNTTCCCGPNTKAAA